MLNVRRLAFSLAAVLVGAAAAIAQETPSKPAEPDRAALVASFKDYIANNIKSYETDRREHVRRMPAVPGIEGVHAGLPAGWVRMYWEAQTDYSIDLRSTDSLISPYLGICEFTLVYHQTARHDTKEAAEKDDNFVDSSVTKHKHTYGYQDGKWVPTSRQNYDDYFKQWRECDFPYTVSGEPNDDELGCWEENAKHLVKH
ncbi:MAG TPA: hypothetical protein VG860_03670 [Terriglobia bacterium]|jgi:hypothetical protein|nr:hypothetical protein [Terriglobia bacterium]